MQRHAESCAVMLSCNGAACFAVLCCAGSQVPLSLSAEAARNLRLMEERSLQAERMCDSALKVTSPPNPHCQPASHAVIRPSHSELGVAELRHWLLPTRTG
jgi:hypothetical protein